MPKKTETPEAPPNTRFEYRVWGKHRKARRRLKELASEENSEEVADCYLLVDDPAWNAKVRARKLKIKRLVAENKGFERWSAAKHRSSETAPSPFDELFEDLRLDRLRANPGLSLRKAVKKMDPELGVRAVFVTKKRKLYRVGDLKAEVTDIWVAETKQTLRTLAIEGENLDELVALRKKLGLRSEPNTPVHQAIESEVTNGHSG